MTTPDIITELESYWESWSDRRRRPNGEPTESEARHRHEAGEQYTVVLGNAERPVVVRTCRETYGTEATKVYVQGTAVLCRGPW